MKKLFAMLMAASMLAIFTSCESKSNTEDYTFEDISFKVNPDCTIEEQQEEVYGTRTTKEMSISLDEDHSIWVRCYGYEDLTDPAEIIDQYEQGYDDMDGITILSQNAITINKIEMKNQKYTYDRGTDPVNYSCSELYYFVHNGRLYIFSGGSYGSVNQVDYTDDFKNKLFDSKEFKELKKVVNTIETN